MEGGEGQDVEHRGRQGVRGSGRRARGTRKVPADSALLLGGRQGAGGREGQCGEGVREGMQEEAEGTRQGEMDEWQEGRQAAGGAERHLLEGAGSMRVIEANRETFHRYMARYAGGEERGRGFGACLKSTVCGV